MENKNKDIDHIRLDAKIVPKAWGHEEWIYNEEFCGKILRFRKGGKTRVHVHQKKSEAFRIISGKFKLIIIDTHDGSRREGVLEPTNIVFVKTMLPHQIVCLEDGELIEVSSHHEDSDSYYLEERK